MKRLFTYLILIVTGITCYAQISYEKGYYITNSGTKVEGLIKNLDWNKTPDKFKFKNNENSDSQTLTLDEVAAFEIYDVLKYERHEFRYDKTNNNLDRLTTERAPLYADGRAFLQVLVEGKASLYYYSIYKKDTSSPIELLVYKKYRSAKGDLLENNDFRKQLYTNLTCDALSIDASLSLDYYKSDLIEFFKAYNVCQNSEAIVFKPKKKDLFNLTVLGGFEQASLDIEDTEFFGNIGFGSMSGFKFGVELEYILPFNQNKWSVILQPLYQSFKAENTLANDGVVDGFINAEIDYRSIEAPLGIRYSFFLNDSSKLSIDFSYLIDLSLGSDVDLRRLNGESLRQINIDRDSLVFGLGYKYQDRYMILLRYTPESKAIVENTWNSGYSSFSALIGYTLF